MIKPLLNFRIPPELLNEVKTLAEASGFNVSQIVVAALKRGVPPLRQSIEAQLKAQEADNEITSQR